MAKLPKNISMNGRARSGNLSQRSLSWMNRTSERSGTAIIRNLMKAGFREPKDIDDQTKSLLKNIKKLQTRIQKAKAFGTPPIGRETEATKERAAKLLKWEGLLNRQVQILQILNDAKISVDKRELSKFRNKQKAESVPGVFAHHRNSPNSFMDKVTFASQTQKQKKIFPKAIQEEIDKVFGPSEDEFEAMFHEDDEE